VRVSEPCLLEELMSALLHHGCLTNRTSSDSCLVVHVHAHDAVEARHEIAFFVRAWRLAHPDVSVAVCG
jgi:hypothetical protein